VGWRSPSPTCPRLGTPAARYTFLTSNEYKVELCTACGEVVVDVRVAHVEPGRL
jgi:hypothetical protein